MDTLRPACGATSAVAIAAPHGHPMLGDGQPWGMALRRRHGRRCGRGWRPRAIAALVALARRAGRAVVAQEPMPGGFQPIHPRRHRLQTALVRGQEGAAGAAWPQARLASVLPSIWRRRRAGAGR